MVQHSLKLKHIAVNEKNYYALKQLGRTADSFNDVITELLKKLETPQSLHVSRQRKTAAAHVEE